MAELEHPALLYRSRDDFLATMVPFVSAGVEQGGFVFVAARAGNLAALRAELGARARLVRWADTERWHPHPASRLRAFHELASERLGAGATRLWLAGEPVWPPGPAELVREWQRYESVLNAVLAPFPATLLCLYDAATLDRSLLDAAHRTHPTVERDGTLEPSGRFQAPAEFLRRHNPRPPPPPSWAAYLADPLDLAGARDFLREQALCAGIRVERAGDLCSAANEVLTNALVHGEASARLWAWPDDGRFVCQIEERGHAVTDPLAGYLPAPTQASGGRGLWLARQLVDLLQIVPHRLGTVVRLQVRRPHG